MVAIGALLPLTGVGRALGFVHLPADFFLVLTAMVAAYLGGVEVVKRWFYRRFTGETRVTRRRR